MRRRSNLESFQQPLEPSDLDSYRTKNHFLDTALQKCIREKNNLAQELEQARYEILKRQKDHDSKIALKETELRRLSQKLKLLESEFRNTHVQLGEELKTSQENNRTFEIASDFMFSSFISQFELFKNTVNSFRNVLLNIGWFQKKAQGQFHRRLIFVD